VASIFDDLRAGLNSLLDRVAGDDAGPVPDRTPDEIRKILEQRAEQRTESLGRVHPIAKRAGADPDARGARERIARNREARVHKRRAQRQRSEQRAHDAAFEEAKRQAYAGAASSSASSSGARSSSSSSSSSRRRAPSFGRKKNELAKHYETLDVPYGADFAVVKKAFRKLMRRYHPDMHSGSPDKQKAAGELSRQLTVAYNELEEQLTGK